MEVPYIKCQFSGGEGLFLCVRPSPLIVPQRALQGLLGGEGPAPENRPSPKTVSWRVKMLAVTVEVPVQASSLQIFANEGCATNAG